MTAPSLRNRVLLSWSGCGLSRRDGCRERNFRPWTKYALSLLCLLLPGTSLLSQPLISDKKEAGYTPLIDGSLRTPIYTDPKDDGLVQRAARFLQQDIEAVTGQKAALINSPSSPTKTIVIIGTLDHCPLIQQMIKDKKINVDAIKGQWDAYQMQVVDQPAPGIDQALVIAGSNKRGAAYGVFDLSKAMGVSPWYWWADVPVKKKAALFVRAGAPIVEAPKIKYRGIFINDEAPALTGWSDEKFHGLNHEAYEKIFELLLRLKANYLWPAMWRNAFNEDDKLNPVLADDYGIIMGTAHNEPMLRSRREWRDDGKGDWNYVTNEAGLKEFWKEGIERIGNRENVVAIGMRGDGDKPMTDSGTPTDLLERIVRDQRQIIADVTKKPASETPQLWALYKEVQDYYDKGMDVPDDVTLLFCDDNWGNIRELPKLGDKPRKGGYGIYYHFDFVGNPKSYKWINTNPLPRIWEQMHLAYEYGVRDMWIVNVGDIKPMEVPLSFFMDYAWNPEKIGAEDLQKYTEQWASDQFGPQYAPEIADIISKYAKYNGRRKPELWENTFSIENYNEAQAVTADYNDLVKKAEKIESALPDEDKDAYFQLVLYPVKACANLQELYTTVALNHQAAANKWDTTNALADKARELFANDAKLTAEYHSIAHGKWDHMMDQPHIGNTGTFKMPETQQMPEVVYLPPGAATSKEPATRPEATTSQSMIPPGATGNIFYERDGYVSIDASHFTKAVEANGVAWKILPDLGRTGSAVTLFPMTAKPQSPKDGSSHLEYDVYTYDKGKVQVQVQVYFSPTLNFQNAPEGLRYGISIDDEPPQIISMNKRETNNRKNWEKWVASNIIIKTTPHPVPATGQHVVKLWAVDPGVVVQKIVLDFGGVKDSFLGPPETLFKYGPL